jgi:UTP--glucose-1-phosphate uridylyltransferase
VTGEEKLRREGLPEEAVAAFGQLYDQLAAGASGTLPDAELSPVRGLAELAALPHPGALRALPHAAVIKLNGGLGTSMGMTGPKSLLQAREGSSFLDVIARQVAALRERYRVRLPLVLMHSFATREASLETLGDFPDVLDFLQHKVPKLRADDLTAVEWPANPALEWCPPGHGDLYAALRASGTLDALLAQGSRYAFVSNADNLGAVLDPVILEWFANSGAPLAMETVIGTEADRKGGHIAWREGRLVLRETAQAAPEEAQSFRDFQRWRYYNTNNLWLDLQALAALDAPPDLPLIVNRKTVDPADPSSPAVIQTETAMGAAISAFEGARALCVPRSRFVPVKTTDDLLALRSDIYRLRGDGRIEAIVQPPYIALDPRYFKRIADFEQRFPHGPPSLRECRRFVVCGDVTFGADIVARGRVEVRVADRRLVPDGSVLPAASRSPRITAGRAAP